MLRILDLGLGFRVRGLGFGVQATAKGINLMVGLRGFSPAFSKRSPDTNSPLSPKTTTSSTLVAPVGNPYATGSPNRVMAMYCYTTSSEPHMTKLYTTMKQN